MERKKIFSCILNLTIFVLTVFSIFLLISSIKFMADPFNYDIPLTEIFKYYTVQSNIFMAIIALVYFAFVIAKKKIGLVLSVLKLVGTVGVSLTFLTVALYLAPISSAGYFSLFANANLFLHFLVPVLSIITFAFFENDNKLELKHTILGMSTMFAYAVFYTINVVSHIENGAISPKYDWYFFVQNGLWTMVIAIPAMFILTFLISFTLTKLNNKFLS